MTKIDLSIIIVNFNTRELLIKLLLSCRQSQLGSFKTEVIVVDNNSIDGSIEAVKKLHPKVKVILNKENLGYSKANNKAIKLSQGEYLLLLNSDVIIQKNTLTTMLEFMKKDSEISASTCRVELANGKFDPACHRGFPTPWAAFTYFSGLEKIFTHSKLFGQYHQTWKKLKTIHEVDVISGAFFLVRKKVIEKVGLLDEQFFVYAEDIDWCYRMRMMGYKIYFNPNTKIIHYKTSSGRKIHKGKLITHEDLASRNKAKHYFFETMKLFYDKYYKDKYPWIIRQIILLGIKIISLYKD